MKAFIFTLMISLLIVQQDTVKYDIQNMKNEFIKLTNNMVPMRQYVLKIYKKGEISIDELIEHISDTTSCKVNYYSILMNSYLSELRTATIYFGEVCAYVIDMILFKEILSNRNYNVDYSYQLFEEYDDYVHAQGYIGYINSIKSIDKHELINVQESYRKWWKINHKKNLKEIRKESRKGNVPLAGSIYRWY